jgi:hypothetical protein
MIKAHKAYILDLTEFPLSLFANKWSHEQWFVGYVLLRPYLPPDLPFSSRFTTLVKWLTPPSRSTG